MVRNTGKDAGGGNRGLEALPGIFWKEPRRTKRNHILFGIRTRHLPHARRLSQQGKLSWCSIRYRVIRVLGRVLSAFTGTWGRKWQRIEASVQGSSPCLQINKTWRYVLWVSGCDLQCFWAWHCWEMSMALPRTEPLSLSTDSASVLTEL